MKNLSKNIRHSNLNKETHMTDLLGKKPLGLFQKKAKDKTLSKTSYCNHMIILKKMRIIHYKSKMQKNLPNYLEIPGHHFEFHKHFRKTKSKTKAKTKNAKVFKIASSLETKRGSMEIKIIRDFDKGMFALFFFDYIFPKVCYLFLHILVIVLKMIT